MLLNNVLIPLKNASSIHELPPTQTIDRYFINFVAKESGDSLDRFDGFS